LNEDEGSHGRRAGQARVGRDHNTPIRLEGMAEPGKHSLCPPEMQPDLLSSFHRLVRLARCGSGRELVRLKR
jgi:hypothetical protein